MRIAYVALHLDRKIMQGGVGIKIAAQVGLWNEMGHSAHLFLHSPDQMQMADATIFSYNRSKKGISDLPAREIGRSRALGRMIEAVRAFQPDAIYLRYGMFSHPLQRLFQIAPVVIELNGDDLNEYRYRGVFYYLLNRVTRSQTLRPAVGFVALSQEIADLNCNRAYRKPTLVLANGIDMDAYQPVPAPANEKPVLGMVFSDLFPWHGLDKLIWLARQYPDLVIELAGYGLKADELPTNVHYHGFLGPEGLREMMARSDVSVGTLALHRKRMKEASPLKVREALALGIPCILAYEDTDLKNLQEDCLLHIPNCEDNVEAHAGEIHAFAHRMVGRRVDIRAVAKRIDQRRKEEERLRFMAGFVKR